MNLIEAISRSDSSYRRELEEIPPDDPVELMKALCGANRESEVFFHLADNKEIADVLVDQWGTPFRIARGEKQQLLLSSAGHDTVFETDDDLPPKRPNNKD